MTRIHVSAEPGYPSTLWVGNSGKYYRTKAQAEKDNGTDAINPEDIKKHEQKWYVKHKLLLTALCAAIVAAFIVYSVKK